MQNLLRQKQKQNNTKKDLLRIVRRVIKETFDMDEDNLRPEFENMIDEIGEQVIENSFYGTLNDEDAESFIFFYIYKININYEKTFFYN